MILISNKMEPLHIIREQPESILMKFPEKWLTWWGPIDWLARSPDLTLMDFFPLGRTQGQSL